MTEEREAPSLEKVNWRRPIPKQEGMRKSASFNTVAKDVSSDAESVDRSPGGVRLDQPFVSPERRPKMSASESGKPRARAYPFPPGLEADDDVFAGQEAVNERSEQTISDRSDVTANATPRQSGSITNVPAGPARAGVHHVVYGNRTANNPTSGTLVQFRTGPVAPNVDAQSLYPSDACVFLANLPKYELDEALQVELTKILDPYHVVQVKIRRDPRQMPFAFCQFANVNDARRATENCEGANVLGRPCRMEMAHAHANFVVYRHDGRFITANETRNLLQVLGEISRVEQLDLELQISFGFPPSMVATYKLYDARRDPVQFFQSHRVYAVDKFEPRPPPGTSASGNRAQQTDQNQRYLQSFEQDRRSLFFGNLPLGFDADGLRDSINQYGWIVNIQMHNKLVHGTNGVRNCFAFVEYDRPDHADQARATWHNVQLHGFTLRVQRKQSQFETPRRGGQRFSPPSGSTVPHTSRSQSTMTRFTSPMDNVYTPSQASARSRQYGGAGATWSGRKPPMSASRQRNDVEQNEGALVRRQIQAASSPAQTPMMTGPYMTPFPQQYGMWAYPQPYPHTMMPQGNPGMAMTNFMTPGATMYQYVPDMYGGHMGMQHVVTAGSQGPAGSPQEGQTRDGRGEGSGARQQERRAAAKPSKKTSEPEHDESGEVDEEESDAGSGAGETRRS